MSLPSLSPLRLPARTSWVLLGALLAGGLAWALRSLLVEPPEVAAACAAAPWAPGPCLLRALAVEALLQQRIGWLALGLALLGLRWRALQAPAAACAAGGLMLYAADPSAPALLLALLASLNGSSSGSPRASSPSA